MDESSQANCETTRGNRWHSNDKDVQIPSHLGTGWGHPEAPRSLRVDKFGSLSTWAYIQATTEIVREGAVYAPGWPENLRFTSI